LKKHKIICLITVFTVLLTSFFGAHEVRAETYDELVVNQEIQADFSNVIKGDVNSDGKISADDIVDIKKHILGIKKLHSDIVKFFRIDESVPDFGVTDLVRLKKEIAGDVANAVTDLVINPTALILEKYQSGQLYANILPSNAITKDVVWQTTNANKVTVDENGFIFAKDVTDPGAPVTITAISKVDGTKQGTCEVTVVAKTIKVTEVVLYPTVKVLDLEKDALGYTLIHQVLPTDADVKTVEFTSSNPDVATVNATTGVVCPAAIGSAIITVTTDDGQMTATSRIVVVNNIKALSLTPDTVRFNMYDGPKTLTVNMSPENATNKDDLVWSSSNPTVAQVVNGTVYPVAIGSAVIIVSTIDGDVKAICAVQVIGDNEYISLNYSYYKGFVGSSMMIISRSHSFDDTTVFTSGNENVAKVDDTGKVTFVGVGKTTIYVNQKDPDGHVINGYCEIEVIQEAASIVITKEITTTVSRSVSIEHSIIPSTTTDKTITWISNNPEIATVSSEGVVTPHKSGTVHITAKTAYSGVYDTCLIIIRENPAPEISDSPLNTHITIFRNQIIDVKGLAVADDGSLTYETSDTAINVTKYGIVKGLDIGKGTVLIKDSTGKVIQQIIVDVTFKSYVETNPASAAIKVGESFKIEGKLASSDPNARLDWTSSDSSVAYVDQEGNVTGLKIGVVVITATADDGSGKYDQTVIFISGADPGID